MASAETDTLPAPLPDLDIENMNKRSIVYHTVLTKLRKTGAFRIGELDIPESVVSTYTQRRVLRSMEEQEWLTRDSKQSPNWRMGETAKLHLNVSYLTVRDAESR